MTAPQEMTLSKCNEKLYASEQIDCTKNEYHRDIRSTIDLYIVRQRDLGNEDRAAFAQAELDRLDAIHGLPEK